MSGGAATVTETTEILPTIEKIRDEAIRRLPVVDDQGALVGIVTLDDLSPSCQTGTPSGDGFRLSYAQPDRSW